MLASLMLLCLEISSKAVVLNIEHCLKEELWALCLFVLEALVFFSFAFFQFLLISLRKWILARLLCGPISYNLLKCFKVLVNKSMILDHCNTVCRKHFDVFTLAVPGEGVKRK